MSDYMICMLNWGLAWVCFSFYVITFPFHLTILSLMEDSTLIGGFIQKCNVKIIRSLSIPAQSVHAGSPICVFISLWNPQFFCSQGMNSPTRAQNHPTCSGESQLFWMVYGHHLLVFSMEHSDWCLSSCLPSNDSILSLPDKSVPHQQGRTLPGGSALLPQKGLKQTTGWQRGGLLSEWNLWNG